MKSARFDPSKESSRRLSISRVAVRSNMWESPDSPNQGDAAVQYLMSVHYVEDQAPPAPEVMEQMFGQVDMYNQKLQAAGAWVFGGGLQTPDLSSVVRTDSGQRVVTDGPFSEAKEQIGGFWVIEAADLDVALDWADQASRACMGPVEVRPFQPNP
jgi:hypothetical protein